jgi:hypothetical protein
MRKIMLLVLPVVLLLSCSKGNDTSGLSVQPPTVPGVPDDLNATILDKIVTTSGSKTKVDAYSYDSQGRIIKEEITDNLGILSSTITRMIIRDNLGRIMKISDSSSVYSEYTDFFYTTGNGKMLRQSIRYVNDRGVLTTDTINYLYSNNRLVEAKALRSAGTSPQIEETYRYSFDGKGNITEVGMNRVEVTGYFAGETVGGWQMSVTYDNKTNPLYSSEDALLVYMGTVLYGSANNPQTIRGLSNSDYSYEYRADGRPRKRTVAVGGIRSEDIYYYKR